MKGFSFPIFKTKIEGVTQTFKLEDPVERRKYFEAKAGEEIECNIEEINVERRKISLSLVSQAKPIGYR